MAWNLLIECSINELPVDLYKIAKQKNWKIVSETEYGNVIEDEVELRKIITSDDELLFIVFKETNNRQRLRFGIAHEMGHILLEHLGLTETELEKEANMFAARLLMPLIVLERIAETTVEQISQLCDVSIEAAEYRLKRLQKVRTRNKFLSNPLEQKVHDNFKNFTKRFGKLDS